MSNRPIIEYVLRLLGEGEWKTDLYSYSDGTGAEKVNLVPSAGNEPKKWKEITRTRVN